MNEIREAAARLKKAGVGGFAKIEDVNLVCDTILSDELAAAAKYVSECIPLATGGQFYVERAEKLAQVFYDKPPAKKSPKRPPSHP